MDYIGIIHTNSPSGLGKTSVTLGLPPLAGRIPNPPKNPPIVVTNNNKKKKSQSNEGTREKEEKEEKEREMKYLEGTWRR